MDVKKGTIIAATFFMLPAIAAADSSGLYATATSPEDWRFEITPYLWTPDIKGDVTVRGHRADVDVPFSDLFDALHFAAAGLGVVHYRQWLIWTQVDYLSLGTSRVRYLSGPRMTPIGASLDNKTTLWTVGAGYQFPGWMEGQTFDVLIGEQGAHLENTLNPMRLRSFEGSRNVLDTVLIVRPSIRLSTRWRFNPTLQGGAGDSQNTYQLQPQFQYNFTERWECRIGYRKLHYSMNGSRGDTSMDVNFSGPLIGCGAIF